jgi:hypothetical protein
MYLLKLLKEINIWRKVRSIAKENEAILNSSGFRVDWVGRIYTVINLPEEVINQPISKEGYVLMKLREYDMLFLNMGIADVISPEMVELEDADSYLLVLSPDRDFIKFWPFLWSMLKTIGLGFLLYGIYRIIFKHWDIIKESINELIVFIF